MLLALSEGSVVAIAVACIAAVPTALVMMMRREVRQIGHAVNHVGPNEPTLIARVAWLEDAHQWNQDALISVGRQVGVHLPRPPERLTKESA